LKDRFALLKGINGSMPDLEKALNDFAIDEYYGKAYDLVLSGKAREAFDLNKESDKMRERYGRTTFGQGPAAFAEVDRSGTRFVQMNWPAVANGNPEVDSGDTHAANFGPLKNLHCPILDRGLFGAARRHVGTRDVEKIRWSSRLGNSTFRRALAWSTSGTRTHPMGATLAILLQRHRGRLRDRGRRAIWRVRPDRVVTEG